MTKNTTNDNDRQWAEVLQVLKGSLTKGQYDSHFLGSTASFTDHTVSVSLPPSANLPMVENRLSAKVFDAIKSATGRAVAVRFEQGEAKPAYFAEPQLDYEPPKPDIAIAGAYHDPRNAIIQPDKVEVFTQYFRKEWRPLLGPTLSELIRELRQRCNKKDNRNHFKATYKSLADAIGVSEATVKRLLKRDKKTGDFKNEYIGYFVYSMETIKYTKGQGNIRNEGTQFVIYLDEPLTPKDREPVE